MEIFIPQYEDRFDKTITKRLMESLIAEAKKRLAEHESDEQSSIHPDVLVYWKNIAQGIPPFGYHVIGEE